MNDRPLALTRLRLALTLPLLALGACAASRGGSAPPAAEAPMSKSSDAEASESQAPREEAAGGEDGAEPTPGSEAALLEESDEQESAEGQAEATVVSLQEQLEQRMIRFEGSLGTIELSCSGAAPHRDAICSIAERICEMEEGPTTAPSEECSRAQESCKKAKDKFAEKCK